MLVLGLCLTQPFALRDGEPRWKMTPESLFTEQDWSSEVELSYPLHPQLYPLQMERGALIFGDVLKAISEPPLWLAWRH